MIRRRENVLHPDLPYFNELNVSAKDRIIENQTIRLGRHISKSPTNRRRFERNVKTFTKPKSTKFKGKQLPANIRVWMILIAVLCLFFLVIFSMNLILNDQQKYIVIREERHEGSKIDEATLHAMKWFELERNKATESLQRRRIARINRTRPPMLGPSNIEELRATYRYTPNSYHKEEQNADEHTYYKKDEVKHEHHQEKRDYCAGHHAKNAFATSYPSFYPLKHMINEDSVIVITGILGRIGFHLALKLSSCNAKVIVAIDGMYPNDPPHRLRQLQQLAHLFARVPHLNKPFILTYDGINPKHNYHPSFEKIINEFNGELDFGVFQPTHIVHLTNAEMNISDSGDSDGIYEFRQSLIGLEQLLASFSQVDSDLHFILASSTLVHEDHQEYIMRNDVISKKKIFQASKEMEETMVKLFAEMYNQHTVLILRLPTIYGPWGKLGNFDYDMVSAATSNWGTEGRVTKMVSDESMNLLYIDDAIDVITSAMQFKDNDSNYAEFDVKPDPKVSSSGILKFIESCLPPGTCATLDDEIIVNKSIGITKLGWAPKWPLSKGLKHLIAWHLDRYHSDHTKSNGVDFNRTESGSSFLQRNNESICDVSNIYCLRGKRVLPCASECADPLLCSPSPFDEVIQESQRLTEGCQFVSYTFQFSKSASKIQINAPDGGGECNIAFVSKYSKLAKTVAELNSNSSHLVSKNGWTLVLVDIENEVMNGDLKSLLKISPGLFMHIRVRKALFLSDNSHMNLLSEDIQFIKSFMTSINGSDHDLLRRDMKRYNYIKINYDSDALMVLPSIRKESVNTKSIYDGSSDTILKKFTLGEVISLVLDEDPKRSQQASRHVAFYNLARSIFNECDFAVECKGRFKLDLHHWIRTTWIVHNFEKDDARKFRCEWYGEQAEWLDTNEALSFAYVMARLQVERYYSLDSEDEMKDIMLKTNNLKQYDRSTDRYQWHSVFLDNQLIRTIDIRAMIIERSLWTKLRERKKKINVLKDTLANQDIN